MQMINFWLLIAKLRKCEVHEMDKLRSLDDECRHDQSDDKHCV